MRAAATAALRSVSATLGYHGKMAAPANNRKRRRWRCLLRGGGESERRTATLPAILRSRQCSDVADSHAFSVSLFLSLSLLLALAVATSCRQERRLRRLSPPPLRTTRFCFSRAACARALFARGNSVLVALTRYSKWARVAGNDDVYLPKYSPQPSCRAARSLSGQLALSLSAWIQYSRSLCSPRIERKRNIFKYFACGTPTLTQQMPFWESVAVGLQIFKPIFHSSGLKLGDRFLFDTCELYMIHADRRLTWSP